MARGITQQKQSTNPLVVFDFDDTLVRSDGLIRVVHHDGAESVMTTSKFARYVQKSGDVFDYSMLAGENTIVEVLPHFSVMLDAIAMFGPRAVFVLTARHNPHGPRRMLTSLNVPRCVRVIATGSTDPQSKVSWIRTKVARDGHDHIEFFDDNRMNVSAVEDLAAEFPDVRLSTQWVNDA